MLVSFSIEKCWMRRDRGGEASEKRYTDIRLLPLVVPQDEGVPAIRDKKSAKFRTELFSLEAA